MGLIFTPHYRVNFDWRGHKLRVGSVLPANGEQISNGLKDMSQESIRNRFMGSKKEFTPSELKYLSQVDGWNHYALGIEEREGKKRGVGVVRLVRSSTVHEEAEVAITFIDDYQKLGLGTLLMRLILLACAERGIQHISYTYMPQNEGIIRLINKLGSIRPGSHQMDWVQTFHDLKDIDLQDVKTKLVDFLPKN